MLKSKYNSALKRWTSETGGGDGNPWSFQQYSSAEKWLAIVYMLDEENDGILSSGIGVVPASLRNESSSGVSSMSRSSESSNSSRGSSGAARIREMEQSRAGITTMLSGIQDVAGQLSEFMKARANQTSDDKMSPLSRVAALDAKRKSIEDDEECTPNTKSILLEGLKRKKRNAYRDAAKALESSEEEKSDSN